MSPDGARAQGAAAQRSSPTVLVVALLGYLCWALLMAEDL